MTEKRKAELAFKGVIAEIVSACITVAESTFSEHDFEKLSGLLDDYIEARREKKAHELDEE